MQLVDWTARTASKTSAVGRLLLISGLGGVLAAAMVLPVVAATGILVRNTSDKFTTLSLTSASGLPQRSEILDRDGKLIAYVYGVDLGPGTKYDGIDRQPVGYSRISPNMLKAIVAIEDDRYWQHGAIDLKGTIRAVVNDLQHKPVQGGSTIAQQYVKGVLVLSSLGNSAGIEAATAEDLNRKLNELRMAVDVEHTMSKQAILAGYLNDAYYGNGAWGIEAAAETYFDTTAAKLNLVQSATLAGIVENPSAYDPIAHSTLSRMRRNTVLARMMQTGALSPVAEAAALKRKLWVSTSGGALSGCSADTVGDAGFFCDYVIHALLLDKTLGGTTQARAKLLATGGLKIYTTLSSRDQSAATNAVNYVLPAHDNYYNSARNADTEVLLQPGTGKIMAIAEDRPYGTGNGQTEVDYAVNSQYGGGAGVQTGSSSKLFTLITALEQGVPFGFTMTVPGSTTVSGFTNCDGKPVGTDPNNPTQAGFFPVTNSEGPGTSTDSLYTGTTNSINVFFARLEQKVGLCNVVHTAADLGMTRADGKSLFSWDGPKQPPADDLPTFTLGAVNVSPMSMAAAYATVASGGVYCKPIALSKIVNLAGKSLPVPSAGCHQVLSSDVANAVDYILQGVLTKGTAAQIGGIPGYQAAGKTGTSNVQSGNGTPYAAFAGFTTNLVGYVSVFNPISPTGHTMAYQTACYRLESGSQECPGEMFGANAPASTWHMTFDNANLGHARDFGIVSPSSELWSMGNGQNVVQPKKPGGHGKGGGTGGGGPGGGTGGTGGGGGGKNGGPPVP